MTGSNRSDSDQAGLRRLRWSVPEADVSVIEWLDAQHSVSQSMRILIRESIQRDGIVDAVYKPVKQLPRRGRPPQSEAAPEPEPPAAAPSGPGQHSEEPAESAPEPESESTASDALSASAPSAPMDMDAIFGNRR